MSPALRPRPALLVLALLAVLPTGTAAAAARSTTTNHTTKQSVKVSTTPSAKTTTSTRRCPATAKAASKKTTTKKATTRKSTKRKASTRTARRPAVAAACRPKAPAAAPLVPYAGAPTSAPLATTPAPATPPADAAAPAAAPTTAPACCDTTSGPTATPSAPATAPANGKLAVGLDMNARAWADPGYILDKSAYLGGSWIREEVDWNDVEPQRGQFTWTTYDKLMTATAKRGINVILMMMAPPSWAGPSVQSFPTDPADYGRFVAAVVARYGTTGSFWNQHPELPKLPVSWFELWNEPYIEWFSMPKIDPAGYTKLVKAATTAGRAVNPDAKFMIESSAYGDGLPVSWTEAMYQAMPDLNNYFDAVAVHAYGMDLTTATAQWRRTFEDVRTSLVNHGAADRPLWVTEMGFSTCPGTNPDCTTEQHQAELYDQALNTIRTKYSSYVQGVLMYMFNDLFGSRNANDSQGYYGFVRPDFSPKPAATVLQRFTASLRAQA